MFRTASLADLPAFRCGHAQDPRAATGCTVVVAPEGAVCGVDVRGGGPAGRETDVLRPENLVQEVDAIILSGGSVYGLGSADSVAAWMGMRGRGYGMGGAR